MTLQHCTLLAHVACWLQRAAQLTDDILGNKTDGYVAAGAPAPAPAAARSRPGGEGATVTNTSAPAAHHVSDYTDVLKVRRME